MKQVTCLLTPSIYRNTSVNSGSKFNKNNVAIRIFFKFAGLKKKWGQLIAKVDERLWSFYSCRFSYFLHNKVNYFMHRNRSSIFLLKLICSC